MKEFPNVKKGENSNSIKSDDWNYRLQSIEQLSNIRVGYGMTLTESGSLSANPPGDIWAKLSGNSNPYAYQQVDPQPDSTWAIRPNGISGKGQLSPNGTAAYEVNGKRNLDQKIVFLTPGIYGDYRFQWTGSGSAAVINTCSSRSVTLVDFCTGSPISGAAVSVVNGNNARIGGGVTDGTGTYTFSDSMIANGTGYIITNDCAGSFQPGFPSQPSCHDTLYFLKQTIAITCDDPGSTISLSSTVFISRTTADGPGNATFGMCMINTLRYMPSFPAQITISATPPNDNCGFPVGSGYLSECLDKTIQCGINYTFNIPQYKFSDQYVYGEVTGGCPDNGCSTFGPQGRNLYPKFVDVRFSTTSYTEPSSACDSLFMNDEGQWIRLIFSVTKSNVFGCPQQFTYDSGCRVGAGNYIDLYRDGSSSFLNCHLNPGPYTPAATRLFFNSTRVTLANMIDGNGNAIWVISYNRYGNGDCTYPPSSQCGQGSATSTGIICQVYNSVLQVGPPCAVTDLSYSSPSGPRENFGVEIRAI